MKKPVFDPVWPSSVAEDFEALRYGKDAVGLAQMTAQRREAAGGMRPSYLTDVFAMLDDFRINNINKVRNVDVINFLVNFSIDNCAVVVVST